MQMSSKKLTIGAVSHVTQCGAQGFFLFLGGGDPGGDNKRRE